MLSAQLDGEDDPADRARTQEHLSGCAGCRGWLDSAATVNRLTRTSLAVPAPDLSVAILAALPGAAGSEAVSPRRPRLVAALFLALAGVGAVQLMLGLAQVGPGRTVDHAHPGVDLAATPGHLWHESAAWNVAVGAAFLFMALRRSRPTGLLPMLSAFVGMLVLLSLNDLMAGRVEVARLVSHGFVMAGYLIVIALSRSGAGDPADGPTAGGHRGTGWRARFDEAEPAPSVPTGLRLVRRSGADPVVARLATPAPDPVRADRTAA